MYVDIFSRDTPDCLTDNCVHKWDGSIYYGILVGESVFLALLSLQTAIFWGQYSNCRPISYDRYVECRPKDAMPVAAAFASIMFVILITQVGLLLYKKHKFLQRYTKNSQSGEYEAYTAVSGEDTKPREEVGAVKEIAGSDNALLNRRFGLLFVHELTFNYKFYRNPSVDL